MEESRNTTRESAVVASLLRRLGTLDLALITIGAVIGSGIFRTPSVVAQRAHVPALILACWALGGVVAVIGAFVFAELAARRPLSGGLFERAADAVGKAGLVLSKGRAMRALLDGGVD